MSLHVRDGARLLADVQQIVDHERRLLRILRRLASRRHVEHLLAVGRLGRVER